MVTDCPANLNSIWFEVKRLSIREQWANFGRPGCVEVQPRSQGSLLLVRSLAPGDGKERTLGTRLRRILTSTFGFLKVVDVSLIWAYYEF